MSNTLASPLFLGLDLSSQALKASLFDVHLHGIDEVQVRFDTDMPEFGTVGGILPHAHPMLDDPDAAAAPVAMYIAAMDKLWHKIQTERHWPVERIAAMSAAGQQHASVYWANGATEQLRRLDGRAPLSTQLTSKAFSRSIVPNWQDATTLTECDELMHFADTYMQGDKGASSTSTSPMCEVTGSIAHTRFTGAQILRWRKRYPEQYTNTERITLVSNFVATLLLAGGRDAHIAPLDQSDACGMNLWDMRHLTWNKSLLSFVGSGGTQHDTQASEELGAKLGHVVLDPRHVLGRAGTWLQTRYGISSECLVCQATGDNPATLQCLTPRLGEAVLSLGTSDTILLPSQVYAPSAQYHVFAHPASCKEAAKDSTPPYFLMFVYKNASLAREWARNTYCHGTWDAFNSAMQASPTPKNGTGFFWLRPEIIPWNAHGLHRFNEHGDSIADFVDVRYNVPAMVQSQFLAFRTRILRVLEASQTRLQRVYVVGGAAENKTMCQLLADVLGCEVAKPMVRGRSAETGESIPYNYCSVGAAFRARWVWACETQSQDSFETCVLEARGPSETHAFETVACPNVVHAQAFSAYVDTWTSLEKRAMASTSSG